MGEFSILAQASKPIVGFLRGEVLSTPLTHAEAMEFIVVLERDETTGGIVAKVPQLPGCNTQGRTKKEALENVREAIELYLSVEEVPPATLVGIERVSVAV